MYCPALPCTAPDYRSVMLLSFIVSCFTNCAPIIIIITNTNLTNSSSNDEVWRPGGALDQDSNPMGDSNGDSANNNDDNGDGGDWGSGSTNADTYNPFDSTETNNNGGASDWGSSTNHNDNGGNDGTWAPAADSTSESANPDPASAAVKQEGETANAPGIKAQPHGPEGGDKGNEEKAPVWFMERVCVQLKGSESSSGFIKEINNNSAIVELKDKSTQTLRFSELLMVPPKEHDMVLATGGAEVGVEGELVCIDGTDAILKDATEEFKIVEFIHLAKIVGDL